MGVGSRWNGPGPSPAEGRFSEEGLALSYPIRATKWPNPTKSATDTGINNLPRYDIRLHMTAENLPPDVPSGRLRGKDRP